MMKYFHNYPLTAMAFSFGLGYSIGSLTMHRAAQKYLKQSQALVENAMITVIAKAVKEDLSEEEIAELLRQELIFVKMVMK